MLRGQVGCHKKTTHTYTLISASSKKSKMTNLMPLFDVSVAVGFMSVAVSMLAAAECVGFWPHDAIIFMAHVHMVQVQVIIVSSSRAHACALVSQQPGRRHDG